MLVTRQVGVDIDLIATLLDVGGEVIDVVTADHSGTKRRVCVIGGRWCGWLLTGIPYSSPPPPLLACSSGRGDTLGRRPGRT